MKFDLDKHGSDSFAKWFIISIVHSHSAQTPATEEQFDQMIKAPGYDSSCLDVKLSLNGFIFDLMPDTFDAVEKHMDEQVEERAQKYALALKKMEALKVLMGMNNVEDLEEFINGN